MSAVGAGPEGRIARRFAALKAAGRAGLIPYLTCGDPDAETFARLLAELPEAGADLIEVGMPFSDPMADGPAIQAAGQRALKAGMTLAKTLAILRGFRARDAATPVVLMGYYNPIHHYGVARFVAEAKAAGADGLIVVDMPPEHDEELCLPALAAGLDFIRLATIASRASSVVGVASRMRSIPSRSSASAMSRSAMTKRSRLSTC